MANFTHMLKISTRVVSLLYDGLPCEKEIHFTALFTEIRCLYEEYT